MILTIDVGNTQIHAGVFKDDQIVLRFRKTSTAVYSSDELGIFFRNALTENKIDPDEIRAISVCTVVPSLAYSLKSACVKYFNLTPFILEPGVRTGLRIKYKNPAEVGTDRIANAIAAIEFFPGQNIIIVDLGTATTFCAISKERDYKGGTITAGLSISMQALESRASKLHSVEIVRPSATLGMTTMASIQSGLYFSHLGAMKEIISRLKQECFEDEPPLVIGTGGFSHLFDEQGVFDKRINDLALEGLRLAAQMNQ